MRSMPGKPRGDSLGLTCRSLAQAMRSDVATEMNLRQMSLFAETLSTVAYLASDQEDHGYTFGYPRNSEEDRLSPVLYAISSLCRILGKALLHDDPHDYNDQDLDTGFVNLFTLLGNSLHRQRGLKFHSRRLQMEEFIYSMARYVVDKYPDRFPNAIVAWAFALSQVPKSLLAVESALEIMDRLGNLETFFEARLVVSKRTIQRLYADLLITLANNLSHVVVWTTTRNDGEVFSKVAACTVTLHNLLSSTTQEDLEIALQALDNMMKKLERVSLSSSAEGIVSSSAELHELLKSADPERRVLSDE